MKRLVKKIIILAGLSILLLPQPILSATNLEIGMPCSSNSDCRSGDCEGSQKKDGSGNPISYCDCNDDNDCNEKWGTPTKGSWSCVDGASLTFDLDYCVNKENNEVKATLPEYNNNTSIVGKLLDSILDTNVASANLLQEVKTFKPGLEIRLPGLEFSDLAKTVDEEGYLHIPWIGEFIKAVYNFGLVIVSIVAVVMIIMQGARIVVGGGESKVESYKKIGQIVVGLFIAWGSYAILYTINPALVEFKSLKVKYVEREDIVLYPEGATDDVSVLSSIDPSYLTGKKPSIKEKCLMEKFGLVPGQKPPLKSIKLLDIATVNVNSFSYDAWKKSSDEILASTDPTVQGYLQYMRDVKSKKIYDLLGAQDGAGVVSQLTGIVGISRHSGTPLPKITYDMHVNGLAVDFMTRSNWDINWGGTAKGKPALSYCKNYQKTFEKMKKEYPNDPYKMYGWLEKNITDCFNKFDNGKNPFTSLPKEFVRIFENNGFYWGGYGWGNKLRTDAMHFEYMGDCGKSSAAPGGSSGLKEEITSGTCEVTLGNPFSATMADCLTQNGIWTPNQ